MVVTVLILILMATPAVRKQQGNIIGLCITKNLMQFESIRELQRIHPNEKRGAGYR